MSAASPARSAVPSRTASATPTAPPTATAGPPTPAASPPPRATITPAGTATPCSLTFSDVHDTGDFYQPVLYLACHGVVSDGSGSTFHWGAAATRGQIAQIVYLARTGPP